MYIIKTPKGQYDLTTLRYQRKATIRAFCKVVEPYSCVGAWNTSKRLGYQIVKVSIVED